MRILHLTRDFPPRHNGGISTAVGGLAHASSAAGLTVAVLSFDDWRPRAGTKRGARAWSGLEDGTAVMRVTSPAQLDQARAFAAAQRPHVLHVHHAMLWELAAQLRASLAVPAVLTMHVIQQQMNELRATRERTLSLVAEAAALRAADRIIAPSHAAAAALTRHDASLAPRLRLAPHGVAATADRSRRRGQQQANRFLAVGRFDDVKGTAELFEAIRCILTAEPDVTFTVAGGIPANPRAERRWLDQWERATPPAVRARVRFSGWLTPEALAALYADADVVIAASRFETFGLVALEAMAHGVPIATTAAGGIAELIEHGTTGLLSPVDAVSALVANALALARDPALRSRLSTAAADAVRQRWLWASRLPPVLAVYEEVAKVTA
jgi:glycosyltransferase involved in cell wall biosynthesis